MTQHPAWRFAGHNVLVTAGGDGIGKSIALAFADAGAEVHAVDIDAQALAKLAGEYPHIHISTADVADENAVARVFERQRDEFGGLDTLVNCAGIAGPTALVEEIALRDWRRCLAVNLESAFLCCRQAIPTMRGAGKGCIISLSSTAGWHGYPLRTPYAAAKWALLGLTKSIAMELGPSGIRANAICPGSVDGSRMQRVIAAEAAHRNLSAAQVRQQYTDSVSLRTFIQAEEIAHTALFLASPAAAKITGQAINVDGNIENFGGLHESS